MEPLLAASNIGNINIISFSHVCSFKNLQFYVINYAIHLYKVSFLNYIQLSTGIKNSYLQFKKQNILIESPLENCIVSKYVQ